MNLPKTLNLRFILYDSFLGPFQILVRIAPTIIGATIVLIDILNVDYYKNTNCLRSHPVIYRCFVKRKINCYYFLFTGNCICYYFLWNHRKDT